jgi:iron complex outermembrane receptor protein
MTAKYRSAALNACSAAALMLAAGLVVLAHPASAAEKASNDAAAAPQEDIKEVDAIEVRTTKSRVVAVAPVTSALTAVEPQAIITRKFMEESAPRVGDFSTIAVFAPSMVAGATPNGPGLGDGGKISLRGFSDGSYNITYDGVAWGDTNGPSHHGTAFFPNSTIGGVIIDRGPGNATDLGQANFGGSINLLSLPLESTRSLALVGTLGSFNTEQTVVTGQSGAVRQLNGARFLVNIQQLKSDGYLSNAFTNNSTQLVKGTVPLPHDFSVTALFTRTVGAYNKSDIGDASVAQLEQFGRNFSLGKDPTLQNFYGINYAKKKTDFEYARLEGPIGGGFRVNETVYSYAYVNSTESGANNLATASANKVTLTPGPVYPALGAAYATSLQTSGIPAYYKKNEYRVTGNILKFSREWSAGVLTAGFEYERAASWRYILDIDALTGRPDYREKAATKPGPSGVYVQVPLNISYNEFSGWKQYQTFAQFEWKVTDKLRITPGIKYVNFDLNVNAPVEKLSTGSQPVLNADQVYTRTLPFLTANYRLESHWSVYAQYAQGFLVPKIGNLYVNDLKSTRIEPQLSTNYQVGTVYSADRLSLDADLYYVVFDHKLQTFTDLVTGQAYSTNSGGALYEGIELQGAYVLPHGFSVFANWSVNSSVAKNDPSNPLSNNQQLTAVPKSVGAAGLRFQRNGIFGEDSFIASLNAKFVGDQLVNPAKCSSAPNGVCASNAVLTPASGRLPSSTQADLSMTYRYGNYSVEGQILNLFDSRTLIGMKGSALLPGSNDFALTSAQGGAANAPLYQTPRNFQLTFKAKF